MAELPEEWWTDVQTQLLGLLKTLDDRGEPLIAAHVAMAVECLQDRAQTLQAGPF
jgi:hypothetical protein